MSPDCGLAPLCFVKSSFPRPQESRPSPRGSSKLPRPSLRTEPEPPHTPLAAAAECHSSPIDLFPTRECNGVMPKRNPVLAAFGQNVRKRRDARRITQEVLAERAELDRTYISDIERGTRNLGIENVVRLASALGVT